MKILIVEDSEGMQDVLRDALAAFEREVPHG